MILDDFIYSFGIAWMNGERATLLLNEQKDRFLIISKTFEVSGHMRDLVICQSTTNRPIYGDWILHFTSVAYLYDHQVEMLKREPALSEVCSDTDIVPDYAQEHFERSYLSWLLNLPSENKFSKAEGKPSDLLLPEGSKLNIPQHKVIIDAISALMDKREPFNTIAVVEELVRTQKHDAAGGNYYMDIIDEQS